MKINKLHIFSKNTDAFSSQRGYNYQTLKTLETWIQNFIDKKEEDIYCEFEEDIFHKDILNKKVVFRQLKLYSSNFSFSSEEVIKCISHFFMLHIKSDYNDFNKEYVFETNSSIANQRLNNDALLLKDWHENQYTSDESKFNQYSKKIKLIVSNYINNQKYFLIQKYDETFVDEIIKLFNSLDDDFWQNFTKSIKWRFIGISSENEFIRVKKNIEDLIFRLPFPNVEDNEKQIFGVLLEKVFLATSQENSENRKLTLENIESTILNIGDENDVWYSQRQLFYSEIQNIELFRIGEFYEIIDLINYCRRKKYLIRHKNQWLGLLDYYINNNSINPIFKRKAIYELLFISYEFHEVDYENLANKNIPKGTLAGLESYISFYFIDFGLFCTVDELEKAQTLITLLFPLILEKKIDISYDQLKNWIVKLYKQLSKTIETEQDLNNVCSLLEQKSNFLLSINLIRKRESKEFIRYFEKIIKLLEKAPLYQVSHLGERIDKYIKILLDIDPKDKFGLLNGLEEFSEKLYPFVAKREGNIKLAKIQVSRGLGLLKASDPALLLKALDYFHKAKDNYLQEDTIDGYVSTLVNISTLYTFTGMYFASKHYALAAFRVSTNKELINKAEKSLEKLFYADYKQGSWFNALEIYDKYISIRTESNPVFSSYEDESNVTQRLAMILHFMDKTSFQFEYFINDYLYQLDYIGTEIIKPISEKIDSDFPKLENLKNVLYKDIEDRPLNDIGKERLISFKALGSLWKIKFENSYKLMSIAEEYISNIQIVLSEISLSKMDFHLLKSEVEIKLIYSNSRQTPKRIASNQIDKWEIYVCFFDNPDVNEINKHIIYNTVSFKCILNELSLLKEDEFSTLFLKLIETQGLDKKQIPVNAYQRIHRDLYQNDYYEFSKRYHYEKINLDSFQHKEREFMLWNNSLSYKYDRAFSVEAIQNRFKKTKKSTYITLENLKDNQEFKDLVNNFRKDGWMDWQIISNISNFIINYKIQTFENIDSLKNMNDIEYSQLMNKLYMKYHNMDEKERYIYFPVKAFKSESFLLGFDVVILSALSTYGLESKSSTPNPSSIKSFLEIKFNFTNDLFEENNPLSYIKS